MSWKTTALKRILSTPMSDGPHETPELLDDGIPFVSVEASHDGRIFLSECRGYISKEQHEIYCKKVKPQRNDIFIVKSGSTTGKIVMVDFDDEFSIWSPLALVRCKSEYNQRFVFYYLGSPIFQKTIQDNWSYGTQPNIGMGVLQNLPISFPPRDEQDQIVRYLDWKVSGINRLINAKRRQIALLQEQKQAIINEAVTKGGEGWAEKAFNKLFMIKAGGDAKPEFYSYDFTNEYCYPVFTNSIDKHSVYAYTKNPIFPAETITVTGRGAVGYAIYRDIPFDAIIRLLVLLPKVNLNCKYFEYAINSTVNFVMTTTTITQLSAVQFSRYKICVPPVEEQNEIVFYFDKQCANIDKIINKLNEEIALFAEYRARLISDVVTGKVDVRGVVVPEFEAVEDVADDEEEIEECII